MPKPKTLICIPARFDSKRLPGKPLQQIAGKTLIERVASVAAAVCNSWPNTEAVVATDDERIRQHVTELGFAALMTSQDAQSGTERCYLAVKQLEQQFDWVINLQGDAALISVEILEAILQAIPKHDTTTVLSPVMQLSWPQLDSLRETKMQNPFSGTTAVINAKQEAMWFSKNIIPALKNEAKLRHNQQLSPIFQHLGIYAYSPTLLEHFMQLPRGQYEQLEELEQLRFIEHGVKIQALTLQQSYDKHWRGVDSPADITIVEQNLSKHHYN